MASAARDRERCNPDLGLTSVLSVLLRCVLPVRFATVSSETVALRARHVLLPRQTVGCKFRATRPSHHGLHRLDPRQQQRDRHQRDDQREASRRALRQVWA